jgi:hypothetical protein
LLILNEEFQKRGEFTVFLMYLALIQNGSYQENAIFLEINTGSSQDQDFPLVFKERDDSH